MLKECKNNFKMRYKVCTCRCLIMLHKYIKYDGKYDGK